MLKTMKITETRKKLTSMHEDLRGNETIAVTNRWEKYEAIRETLMILGDPRLMKKLRQSLRESKAGKLIPLAD